MAECSYCGSSFEDEESLVAHHRDEHYDELGRIDRRRVDATAGDSDSGTIIPYVIAGGAIGVVLIGLLAAIFILGGGNGASAPLYTEDVETTPSGFNALHEHGLIDVTIDGEEFDFATDSDLIEADPFWFHVHGGNNVWHTHGEDITLEYALATFGIEVDEGGSVVEYNGVRYDDADPDTTVEITVNGEAVDPMEYVPRGVQGATQAAATDGDHIRVVVERED